MPFIFHTNLGNVPSYLFPICQDECAGFDWVRIQLLQERSRDHGKQRVGVYRRFDLPSLPRIA